MVEDQPKYYSWNTARNCFMVSRKIKNKMIFFGYFHTEEEAKLAVQLFHQYGWDKKNNWRVRAEVKEKLNKV